MSACESEPERDSSRRAVSVTTGSRLHFGLLRTTAPFGGLGVMIDSPRTRVTAIVADEFYCETEFSSETEPTQRVRQIAQRFAAFHGFDELPTCRIAINERPSAHSGLGSGTQLSMAVAEALSQLYSVPTNHDLLARDIAGRGERSAVGIHGFFHGGILFENSPKDDPHASSSINPIIGRDEVPTTWRVALFQPRASIDTICGERERDHFVRTGPNQKQSLQRLVTIAEAEILPAVAAADFDLFADAVQRFNRESGLLFESVQGGPYNGPVITRLVEVLQSLGAVGVGQSSWGPSVFCWFAQEDQAHEFVARVPSELADGFITCVKNSPRSVAWRGD